MSTSAHGPGVVEVLANLADPPSLGLLAGFYGFGVWGLGYRVSGLGLRA